MIGVESVIEQVTDSAISLIELCGREENHELDGENRREINELITGSPN